MWRYGSLGLSKPHLEPIIGVILSQFNQSKRDWGWKGARAGVESVGQTCWLKCLCHEIDSARLSGSGLPLWHVLLSQGFLCHAVSLCDCIYLKSLSTAGLSPRKPQKGHFSLRGQCQGNLPNRHRWHLGQWGDLGKLLPQPLYPT